MNMKNNFENGNDNRTMRIAICENDPVAAEITESFLELMNLGKYADSFYDGNDLIQYEKKMKFYYSIYLLDIDMPTIDGLALAKKIRNYNSTGLIIFITAYPQYMIDTFKVCTFDFLIKPLDYENFKRTIDRSSQYLLRGKSLFAFSIKNNNYSLHFSEIVYIEKMGRKAKLHTDSETYEFYMSTKEIWARLDIDMFVNVHSSYIVNLSFIKSIIKDEIILHNDKRIYISRNYIGEVKKKHLSFAKGKLW